MIREFAKKSWFLRHVHRQFALKTGQPSWKPLLKNDIDFWEAKLRASKDGAKVLIATSVGAHLPATIMESALAVALTLRGAEVHILLCDSILPACLESTVGLYPKQERFVHCGPQKDLCKGCFSSANAMYRSLGVVVHRYSDFLRSDDHDNVENISSSVSFADIVKYSYYGVNIGEHAMAGALRFFARGTLDGEPHAEAVLRRYFKAALLTAYASRRLFREINFESVTLHHGIYVPQGIISEVAGKEKVRVITWNPAYKKNCFIFSHNDTYHHTLMDEPTSKWENIQWTPKMEMEVMDYLKSRWHGTKDWIWFHEKPEENLKDIADELGVDFSKPCVGMLTNVIWDAQLHYPANAFPNMLEWVLQTIRYFANRPELQLLIRIHPAEIRGTIPSRQLVVDEIKNKYLTFPKNVFIISPASNISTYAAMSQCDSVIIYGTKMGVELTSIGIPVIVAGEAWIRNKGITMDATSVKHYFNLLDQLPFNKRMDATMIKNARKYAYHFFFRRMIPLEFMEPTKEHPPFQLQLISIQELEVGRSKGLDVICEGILHKSEFIYPAEQY